MHLRKRSASTACSKVRLWGSLPSDIGVSVTNLAAANRLKKTSSLRVGQVLRIPPKGVVYVYPGQTLTGIAQLNKVGVAALAKANRLKPESTLRVGQRLELPGYSASAKASKARNAILSGLVTLERPASQETLRVQPFRQERAKSTRKRDNDWGDSSATGKTTR